MPVVPTLLPLAGASRAGRTIAEPPPEGFADLLQAQLPLLLPQPPRVAEITLADEAIRADEAPPAVYEIPLLPARLDSTALQQLVTQLPPQFADENSALPVMRDAPQRVAASVSRTATVATQTQPVTRDNALPSLPTEPTAPAAPAAPAALSDAPVSEATAGLTLSSAPPEIMPGKPAPVPAVPIAITHGADAHAPAPEAGMALRASVVAPPGSDSWQQTMGHHLRVMVHQGLQRAELKLHPEDLGTVQVSLRLQQDQAQLMVLSDHPQVRAALEAALPQLRTALAESGIQLGESSVGGGHFSQQQQTQAECQGGGAAPEPSGEEVNIALPQSAGSGVISTFV